MSDQMSILRAMRRPRLLIRAARFGLTEYRRERDLARLIHGHRLPSPATALERLMDQEQRLEETRRTGDASYSISRHVDVLIALMAEARLLPAAPRSSDA